MDLIEPEIAPFDPPIPKIPKHKVNLMTRCGDIADLLLCVVPK